MSVINLIPREKLEHIARSRLKYTLQDAEKDYFLTIVMKIVSESKLSDFLIFKGGTSIYHCYLNQYRFSEDLDFTSPDKNIGLEDIKKLFAQYDFFEIKKAYKTNLSLKIERLKYQGILETPNSIKFEVDKFQNVVLPSKKEQYKNVWGLDFSVNVMDAVEICAEKVRACNDRFRYRDFYDLFMMTTILNIKTDKYLKLLSKKEIRNNISRDKVLKNLNLALNEISESGDTVEYRKDVASDKLHNFFENLAIPSLKSNI